MLFEESDLLETMQRIKEECGSFCWFRREYLSSKMAHLFETLQQIEEKWGSFHMFQRAYLNTKDDFNSLKWDLKFLDSIRKLQSFINNSYVITGLRISFQAAAADLCKFSYKQVRPWSKEFPYIMNRVIYLIGRTKSQIRASIDPTTMSLRLSANKDDFVMVFIDTVENLIDLVKFNDPSSAPCIGGLVSQIEKVLQELKFLRSFVCFISDRCKEPQSQHAFFSHVFDVTWLTIMVTWLYFPSNGYGHSATAPDEANSLVYILQNKIRSTKPSICKIYIDVLQALKLKQSRWYPVIHFKYVVDCQVGFLETLLHHLEELPISSNTSAVKANLQEMLNFLRSDFTKLEGLEFHLQDIDFMIVDAGLQVYSLKGKEKEKEDITAWEMDQALVLDFQGKIQRMQAMIYLSTRKTFILQLNLTGISGVGFIDFVLENWKEFLRLYLNSIDSVKSELQKIQKELKCFKAVMEQQDRLQPFATQANGLVYEVEYIIDACKKKDVPDWCLFLWILNIGEDIRVLMAEVAEIQEKNVSGLVLHNTNDIAGAHPSSQFARNLAMNEEMVGLVDVMEELRGKLTNGSSNLDVISIVGMPGVGKTTLANKLYFDQSVVSHFNVLAQCCVSQQYALEDLLLALLCDVTGETTKLDREADIELADKLRKLLMRKRYLILIDDVWETSALNDLYLCFPEDYNGSRIILTTRHYEVASHAKHVSDPLILRLLSRDESWMLLQNKVFNKESCPVILKDVGKRIAQKCGGLPLSIVLVAGILARMDKDKHCWEQVATNFGLRIQAQSKETINLSYQNLPHHLKPCFLYFGVFLEDREIEVSKLTWLWISEGLVRTHTEKLLEDIAKHYLENLIERNLVMVAKKSSDGKIKACRIHDLLLEFCREKAKLENFTERIKGDRGIDPSHVFPPKYRTPRRLSLHSQCKNLAKWCLSFSHVKSFQFREARKIAFSSIDLASYTFKRFKFLRVLDVEFTIIDSFPQELILLRYLAFRTAENTLSLPANLLDLETLIVQGIRGRVSLPDTIWKLVKLRHLHIYDQAFFTFGSGLEFLESPSKMDDLQTLSSVCFPCVDNADRILAKTPNLRKLRCEFSKFDGSFPAFNNLTKLEMLKISSSPTFTSINQLKLPSDLKKLTLSKFCIHLSEITTLSNLEILKLLGVTISSNVWKVKAEQFSKLKFLKLESPCFSEWDISDDAFPCLEHLVLKRCRHLKVIPPCFGYMPSLKFIEVNSCKESLVESAMAIKEMQVEEMGYSGFQVFIQNQNTDTPTHQSQFVIG